MDNVPFNTMPNSQNLENMLRQIRQNPSAFEENLKRSNPQAYQLALQIRNSNNPQAIVMQMAQARGLSPNILKMFGL
jgi:hypothetical protein